MAELLSDERGAVTTEGVIVAFFFAIVFGLLMHEVRLYRASRAIVASTVAQVDADALEPVSPGFPDVRRTAFFDAARGSVDRWVPRRAPLIDTLDVTFARARGEGRVAAPAYVGGGSVSVVFEDARMRDELPRGGAGGNWDALDDTWCRVEMCAGPDAPGPPPWDTE